MDKRKTATKTVTRKRAVRTRAVASAPLAPVTKAVTTAASAFKFGASTIKERTTYEPYKALVLAFNKHIAVEFEQRINGPMGKGVVGSEEQEEFWRVLLTGSAHIMGVAVAGSGKTFTAVHGIQLLREKLGGELSVEVRTYHSHGMRAINAAAREKGVRKIEVSDWLVDDYLRQVHDIRSVDDWREVSGLVKRLASIVKGSLVRDGDNEELVRLADHYGLDTNGVFRAAVPYVWRFIEWSGQEIGRRSINYDDMPWLPVRLGLDLGKWDLVLVDEAQDTNPVQAAMVRMMVEKGARVVVLGDPRQCQPTGTIISTTGGNKIPIERLVPGQELVSFNSRKTHFPGTISQGRKVIEVASREYSGDLVRVRTQSGYESLYTPEHRCLVRMTMKESYAVYAMRKDGRVRVGMCRLSYLGGCGVAMRARQERADAAWLLELTDNIEQARILESKVAYKFGIGQLIFTNSMQAAPSQEVIDSVYGWLEKNDDMIAKLESCLEWFGRSIRFPIWRQGTSTHIGWKSFVTQACNLVDGTLVKVFNGHYADARWEPVSVSRERYSGKVYSLSVEAAEDGRRLYIADGIVTHNSIYGFRGADVRAMDNLRSMLEKTREVKELGLTYTRRCGKKIVEAARVVVPVIHAMPDAPEGRVRVMWGDERDGKRIVRTEEEMMLAAIKEVKEGDMVLCRANAPLIEFAYGVLKRGVKAVIRGREIGKALADIVRERLTGDDPNTFRVSLVEWFDGEDQELARLGERGQNKRAALSDRMDCLMTLMQTVEGGKWRGVFEGGEDSFKELMVARIEGLFADVDEDGRKRVGVLCGTVHKMKGLEAEKVWLIKPELIPHPKVKSGGWEYEQEKNIFYVAVTRAREELVVVGSMPGIGRDEEGEE